MAGRRVKKLDPSRIGLGASMTTLPSAPRLRSASEEENAFGSRPGAGRFGAEEEVEEKELDWGMTRTGGGGGGGGATLDRFGATAPDAAPSAAHDDSSWGNLRGSGPAAPAPSAAHDDSSWGNLRGGGSSAPAPAPASSGGKYRPPTSSSVAPQEAFGAPTAAAPAPSDGKYRPPSAGGSGFAAPAPLGGSQPGRFAALGSGSSSGGGGGFGASSSAGGSSGPGRFSALGGDTPISGAFGGGRMGGSSAFGASRRDRDEGGRGGGGMGRRDNAAFSSGIFGSSGRRDEKREEGGRFGSSSGSGMGGGSTLTGMTNSEGQKGLSVRDVSKAQGTAAAAAAVAPTAGTHTSTGASEAQLAAHLEEDREEVLRTLKAKWKGTLEDWQFNMAPSATATAVDTLASYKCPPFHTDAVSVVLTRAARAKRDADKTRLVGLANALRTPPASGGKALVSTAHVWAAAAKTLTMLQKKGDTFAVTEAAFLGVLQSMLSADGPFPLADDELFEAEEDDAVLGALQTWANGAGLLSAAAAAEAQGETAVTVEDATASLMAAGLKGEALKDAALAAYQAYPKTDAAAALTTAVLKAATDDGSLGNVRCPWAEEEEYGAALEGVMEEDVAAGVASLFAVQAYLNTAGWPKGVVEGIFLKFYQEDIVDDAAFAQWKEDTTTKVPGRMQAIIQTNKWFTWFAEQQSDSEDEESDEEED